jgi:putative PIN family toxin of toxin-antitoxin system
MKAVLDTNILVSATFWNGDPYRIVIRAEKGDFELLLSPEIIREFTEVLNYDDIRRKILDKDLSFRLTVAKITSVAKIISPTVKLNIVKEDPDDNKILECALAGKADYMVTNDRHLLTLKQFRGIPIVTAREFLEACSA